MITRCLKITKKVSSNSTFTKESLKFAVKQCYQITFNKAKIDEKFQNETATFLVIFNQYGLLTFAILFHPCPFPSSMLTFVVAFPLCIWYLHHTVSSLACDAKIPPGPTEMYLISCTFKSARTQEASDKLESEQRWNGKEQEIWHDQNEKCSRIFEIGKKGTKNMGKV